MDYVYYRVVLFRSKLVIVCKHVILFKAPFSFRPEKYKEVVIIDNRNNIFDGERCYSQGDEIHGQ